MEVKQRKGRGERERERGIEREGGRERERERERESARESNKPEKKKTRGRELTDLRGDLSACRFHSPDSFK